MIKPVKWKTKLELLSDKAVQDIHEASLQIMEHTGLIMPLDREKQEEACDLGLQLDRETNRIRFPPDIIETAIEKAPNSYALCARKQENDVLLDGHHGYLRLDGTGTQILDLETGAIHNSTKADLQKIAQIADALPQIFFLWPAISAQDYPARVQPLHELEALLNYSSKHVQAMTAVDALNARGTVEIAVEVVGDREKLKARLNDRARNIARQFFAPHDHHPVQPEYQHRRGGKSAATHFLSNHEPETLTCSKRIGEIIAANEYM